MDSKACWAENAKILGEALGVPRGIPLLRERSVASQLEREAGTWQSHHKTNTFNMKQGAWSKESILSWRRTRRNLERKMGVDVEKALLGGWNMLEES